MKQLYKEHYETKLFEKIVALQKQGYEVLSVYNKSLDKFPFPTHADVGVKSAYVDREMRLVEIGAENERSRMFFPVGDDYRLCTRRTDNPIVWKKAHAVYENEVLTVFPEEGESFVLDMPKNGINYPLDAAQKLIASDVALGLFIESIDADPDDFSGTPDLPRVSNDQISVPARSIIVDTKYRVLVAAELYFGDKGTQRAMLATFANNKVSQLRISDIPNEYTVICETPKKKYSSIANQIGDTNSTVTVVLSPFVTDASYGYVYVLQHQGMTEDEFYEQILVNLQNSMNVPIEKHWVQILVGLAETRGIINKPLIHGPTWINCARINLDQDEWIALVNDAISEQKITFSFHAGSLPEIEVEEKVVVEEGHIDTELSIEDEEIPEWPV